jgi:hypothetical protein
LKIREEYNKNKSTYVELGLMFGVDKRNVGKIIKRERWKNL